MALTSPARFACTLALAGVGSAALTEASPAGAAVRETGAPESAITVTDTARTSMDGVYTVAQATRGKDIFAAYCRSCHTPTVHSGPPF
ncbi:MAG TPA: hypothetical protein VE861_12345, partial [Gemmatimonadaceae bacterium]|nr:hypothetical protein [Gemmatimonadaceae bacterium]